MNRSLFDSIHLRVKCRWVRRETLKIHKAAPATRIASSLSCVEILTALHYGGVRIFDPQRPLHENRDRLILSKGHGAISFYPILADLGCIHPRELLTVAREGTRLGGIPDCIIPGFETTNGSLGHGLGVACGMALALRLKKMKQTVFVLVGDGELYEGSIWEAVMFAGHHGLDNIVLIVDDNGASMLDFSRNIINLQPLPPKFTAFGWDARETDGHDAAGLVTLLAKLKNTRQGRPKVLVARTVKGRGVPRLETDPLSHIRNLTADEVDQLIEKFQ